MESYNPDAQIELSKIAGYWPITRNDGTAASVGEYLVNRVFTSASLAYLQGPADHVANPTAETFHLRAGLGNALRHVVTDKGSPGADRTASDWDSRF